MVNPAIKIELGIKKNCLWWLCGTHKAEKNHST